MAKYKTYKNVDEFSREVLGLSEYEIWLSSTKNRMIFTIIETRKAKGISQKDLATMLGTTQSVISRIEGGPSRGITIDYLMKMASVLGITPRITLKKSA